MAYGGYRPAGLRRAPEWARLPAGCCFRVQNLRDGIPEPSVILPLSVESSPLAAEPSMIFAYSVEGSLLRPEPSMIFAFSVEGSPLRHEPSMISTSSMEGYCARFHTHIHLADH